MVVVWSSAAIASENVKSEARWARRNERLIQAFIDACEPPLFFGERQGVDLTHWAGSRSDPSFRLLVDAVREKLGQPSQRVGDNQLPIQPASPSLQSPEQGPLLPLGGHLNGLFEVRRLIARGGAGEIFEGANLITGERVAIKALFPTIDRRPGVQDGFMRYLRLLTRLSHPAINSHRLAAREPGSGVLYIVNDFIDGVGLESLVGQVTAPESKLRQVALRLAGGLSHAHAMGVIHSELTPNVIIAPRGQLDACTIVEFGFPDELRALMSPEGAFSSHHQPYAAPEQRGGFGANVGPWTDVYSLGHILLALAVGSAPMPWQNGQGPLNLSTAPRGLHDLFNGMLAADPKERLPNMEVVIEELQNWAD